MANSRHELGPNISDHNLSSIDIPDINALRPPSLLRQSSGVEQRECFCSDSVGGNPATDLRLSCRCLVHRQCLITYLRIELGDRAKLLNTIQNSGCKTVGILCPYARAQTCAAVGSASFITVDDMQTLLASGDSSQETHSSPDDALTADEIGRLQRWVDEDTALSATFAATSPKKVQSAPTTLGAAKEEPLIDYTDVYIAATTKPCPTCQFRVTHWHGHSCHHIQPGGGCPKCKEPFCYKCLSSAQQNRRHRGGTASCLCGGWSNFCSEQGITKNLSLTPFPYDKRCGCFICPDCALNKPCALCPGHCVVCRGLVPPGPRDFTKPYQLFDSNTTASDTSNSSTIADRLRIMRLRERLRLTPTDELFQACRSGAVGQILAAFTRPDALPATMVDARDNIERTPLFYAVDSGSLEAVRLLVEVYRADVFVADSQGNTPLHHAAEAANLELCRLLLDLATSHLHDNLQLASGNSVHNTPQLISLRMVAALNRIHASPIHVAISHDATEIFQLFAERITSINTADNRSRSSTAASQITVSSSATAAQSSGDIVADRASREAMSIGDLNRRTPLHFAAQHGNVTIVRSLLNVFHVARDVPDNEGQTPLHVIAEQGNVEVLDLLLGLPSNVRSVGTAEAGGSHTVSSGGNAKLIAKLGTADRRLNYLPVHYAVRAGHVDMTRRLLQLHPASLYAPIGQAQAHKTLLMHLASRNGGASRPNENAEVNTNLSDDDDNDAAVSIAKLILQTRLILPPQYPPSKGLGGLLGLVKQSKHALTELDYINAKIHVSPTITTSMTTVPSSALYMALHHQHYALSLFLIRQGAHIRDPVGLLFTSIQRNDACIVKVLLQERHVPYDHLPSSVHVYKVQYPLLAGPFADSSRLPRAQLYSEVTHLWTGPSNDGTATTTTAAAAAAGKVLRKANSEIVSNERGIVDQTTFLHLATFSPAVLSILLQQTTICPISKLDGKGRSVLSKLAKMMLRPAPAPPSAPAPSTGNGWGLLGMVGQWLFPQLFANHTASAAITNHYPLSNTNAPNNSVATRNTLNKKYIDDLGYDSDEDDSRYVNTTLCRQSLDLVLRYRPNIVLFGFEPEEIDDANQSGISPTGDAASSNANSSGSHNGQQKTLYHSRMIWALALHAARTGQVELLRMLLNHDLHREGQQSIHTTDGGLASSRVSFRSRLQTGYFGAALLQQALLGHQHAILQLLLQDYELSVNTRVAYDDCRLLFQWSNSNYNRYLNTDITTPQRRQTNGIYSNDDAFPEGDFHYEYPDAQWHGSDKDAVHGSQGSSVPSQRKLRGLPLLHLAIICSREQLVERLLTHNRVTSAPEAISPDSRVGLSTPGKNNIDAIDMNARCSLDASRALHHVTSLSIARLLLQHNRPSRGDDPTLSACSLMRVFDAYGCLPLHRAAQRRLTEVVALFLSSPFARTPRSPPWQLQKLRDDVVHFFTSTRSKESQRALQNERNHRRQLLLIDADITTPCHLGLRPRDYAVLSHHQLSQQRQTNASSTSESAATNTHTNASNQPNRRIPHFLPRPRQQHHNSVTKLLDADIFQQRLDRALEMLWAMVVGGVFSVTLRSPSQAPWIILTFCFQVLSMSWNGLYLFGYLVLRMVWLVLWLGVSFMVGIGSYLVLRQHASFRSALLPSMPMVISVLVFAVSLRFFFGIMY